MTIQTTCVPTAEGVPFWTPAQIPPAGTARAQQSASVPTVFQPLTIRSVTLNNRFVVSPMCMYSSPPSGHMTDFHLVHLGQFALNGAGLVFAEAIAVQPRGRISPSDAGIWDDSHVGPLKRIVDFIHSQGQKAGVQLAHAGRKASTFPPWIQIQHNQREQQQTEPAQEAKKDAHAQHKGNKCIAGKDVHGWPDDVVAPSAIKYEEGYPEPRAMSVDEIKDLLEDYKKAARRAVEAGFDVFEIHAAHGYLLTEFLSPLSNTRTDQYGGSFENRTRILFEVISAVRSVIPSSTPLFVRVSATEWMTHVHPTPGSSLDLPTTIRLCKLLYAAGVDLVDVSSAANSSAQRIPVHDARYQLDLARGIRDALKEEGGEAAKLLVGAVGRITDAETAKGVAEEDADAVFVARQFLRDPALVRHIGQDLGVDVKWSEQYHMVQPKI